MSHAMERASDRIRDAVVERATSLGCATEAARALGVPTQVVSAIMIGQRVRADYLTVLQRSLFGAPSKPEPVEVEAPPESGTSLVEEPDAFASTIPPPPKSEPKPRGRPPIPECAYMRHLDTQARERVWAIRRSLGSVRATAMALGTMPSVVETIVRGGMLLHRTADFVERAVREYPVAVSASHIRAPK